MAQPPRDRKARKNADVIELRPGRLSDARRYTPRGKTVREASSKDPFRPALAVVDGGRRISKTRGNKATPEPSSTKTTRATKSQGPRKSAPKDDQTPRKSLGSTVPKPRVAKKPAGSKKKITGLKLKLPRLPRLGNPIRRVRFALIVMLVFFVAVAARLVQLQVTDAGQYAADALTQRLRSVTLAAPRGALLDRAGAVLTHSVEARFVFADPKLIDDPSGTADQISPLLGVPKSELMPKLSQKTRPDGSINRFIYLARGVDIPVGDAVEALNLPGIGVDRDERREQPGHDLAANVLGFTGRDLSGLTGLEASYDETLRGTAGERTVEVGRNGREIPDGYRKVKAAHPGRSLQLTLDRDLQYEAQRALFATMQKSKATTGSAVVLDPKTGEILALASYPTYDAANPLAVPPDRWNDVGSGAVVEPGSVHKAIVLGAALEQGAVKADEVIDIPETITKGDTTYTDTHSHETDRITLPGILAHSSNVGTIKIASRLGANTIYEYQRKFGLGESTRAGVPGEAEGLVQPPSRWSGSSYGSIPIGLGVAVTPLQMASVYATIANNGVRVQPHLLKNTIDANGKSIAPVAPVQTPVLSPQTAQDLRRMMEAVVVAPDATGRGAAIPGYRVAGKTGSGLRAVNNRYLPGTVSSFVGMAPADNPRYVVAVFAHGPGGAVVTNTFRDIMSYALRHYRVPPTGTKPPNFKVYV